MGANSSDENTPNAPEFICPSPKVLDFNEKRLHWASVVRGVDEQNRMYVFVSAPEVELSGPEVDLSALFFSSNHIRFNS